MESKERDFRNNTLGADFTARSCVFWYILKLEGYTFIKFNEQDGLFVELVHVWNLLE